MPKSPALLSEQSRIEILRGYEVLDTLPELAYDNITKLASIVCQTPIALVSLADESRQWFKSKFGLELSEIARDVSFCDHAIYDNDGVFEVADATIDARFIHNPLVTGPTKVVFYAGAALKARSGEVIGTLCVVDHQAKKLTAMQRETLKILADQVVVLLELRKSTKLTVDTLALQRSAEIEQRNLNSISKQAADQLATEKNKLDAMIASSPAGLALVRGHEFVFEVVNQKFTELVGNRDYIGRRWKDVYAELSESPLPEIMKNVLETGVPFSAHESEIRVEVSPGILEDRFYNIDYTRILDSAGRPYGIFVQTIDTTEQVRAKKALERSQSDLANALESMSDGFFTVDCNWNYTYVNQNMEKATGLSKKDLLGQSHLKLFFSKPEQQDSKNWREYHRVMKDRVTTIYEDYYEPLDMWSAVRIYPKPDGGLAVFFSDITDAKKAERLLQASEVSFKAITEATPLIVWTATPDGLVDYANSRWYEFSGITKEQTLGMAFLDSVHASDVEGTKAKYADALVSLKPLEIEHRFRKFDGTYRWFLTRAVPSIDERGKATKWFGTNVDIEDQKRVAVELSTAKFDAERASHAKSAFLANMSHEIRTPLGAIIGFTDLLRESDVNSEQRSQYLDTISRSGKALTKIIDDILDLAKVESGKINIEKVEFSIHELIDDVLDLFRERAKSKGIYLRSVTSDNIPTRLISDPTRLRQILINLIGNAVKFTENGGVSVSVKGTLTDKEKIQLILSVKDTGIGLSLDQQAKLFEPFMQADTSTTRKFGGTGLGLALSKRLATALGGDVNIVDSELHKGCTFVVSIPTLLVEERKYLAVAPVVLKTKDKLPSLHGLKVLVAEDSEDNQMLIKIILNKLGVEIDFAFNGLEAYQKAISGNFDIVLMDIQMPVMDGYEATRKLRASGFTKPIIALTAHAMAEERAQTKAAGCTSHLTKPIDKEELLFTLEEYVTKENPAADDRKDH